MPASLQIPRTSMSSPVNHHPTRSPQKKNPASFVDPTFDIPFGSNKTSAKRTSPAAQRIKGFININRIGDNRRKGKEKRWGEKGERKRWGEKKGKEEVEKRENMSKRRFAI